MTIAYRPSMFFISLPLILFTLSGAQQALSAERQTLAERAFERTGVRLVMLGHVDHGKTTLTSAMTKVLSNSGSTQYVAYDKLDNVSAEMHRGIPYARARVEFATPKRRYTLFDLPGHSDIVKALIMEPFDAAILVVSAADGPMPQTREHILLAKQTGIPYLIVFMNKVDMVDDRELLELVEMEVRELLSKYDYPGDDVLIVQGSALKALEDPRTDIGIPAVQALINALDNHIPESGHANRKPFLMPIDDVFSIPERGTVVAGRVERGQIRPGDALAIVGLKATTKTVATQVEMFRKFLKQAATGDPIGVELKGIPREAVRRGQVLAQPGSIMAHTYFEAEIYMQSRAEKGREKSISTGYRPQFYFRNTDVPGSVTLPKTVNSLEPGDNHAVTVRLTTPIAMEPGSRFAIREGGRTVGVGVVSRVLDPTK